ncbi:MAG: HAMP domain-containing sensor histidine kinase [Acidobacteriota bacterium]
MLHEFLALHRAELIARSRSAGGRRLSPAATEPEIEHGMSLLLDQLIRTLRRERAPEQVPGPAGSGLSVADGTDADLSEIAEGAARHGRELLQDAFSVEQLVHYYGDLRMAITDLAYESHEAIATEELRTLHLCLDVAIGAAVSEYNFQRDFISQSKQAHALNERLGFLAHELRNLLNSATLAIAAIKAADVKLGGATGAVLDRSLIGMRHLIDQSLSEVRTTAGIPSGHEVFSLSDFIVDIKLSASLEAQMKECRFTVSPVDPRLALDADRDMLFSAVGNLLQNAFKFTRPRTEVTLTACASGNRIRIDVADTCGGLPPGDPEALFLPFTQGGSDKTGLGLGLSISRDSVAANGGTLSVRDIAGTGCVFSIDLPRHSLPEPQPLADRRAR